MINDAERITAEKEADSGHWTIIGGQLSSGPISCTSSDWARHSVRCDCVATSLRVIASVTIAAHR